MVNKYINKEAGKGLSS